LLVIRLKPLPLCIPPAGDAGDGTTGAGGVSGRRGRSGPGCALRRPPSRPNPRWTTSSAVARRSVRLSPS